MYGERNSVPQLGTGDKSSSLSSEPLSNPIKRDFSEPTSSLVREDFSPTREDYIFFGDHMGRGFEARLMLWVR